MKINAELDHRFAEEGFEIKLTFELEPSLAQGVDNLCFSMAHPIAEQAIVGGTLIERQGDWHRLALDEPVQGRYCIAISGEAKLIKATDLPQGLYLESDGGFIELELPDLTERKCVSAGDIAIEAAQFIPLTEQHDFAEAIEWPSSVCFQGDWNSAWLQRLLARLQTPVELVESPSGWVIEQAKSNEIAEDFDLSVRPEKIRLRYKNESGRRAGEAYCYQYLLQLAVAGQLQALTLKGTPRYGYRGVHLDVVRHFFAIDDILSWLDLFALLQFNYFHWHLTDDDGWRLQSHAFPELTETGAWRGAGEVLPAQMGTGWQRYGGFYTPEQARQVVHRAGQLGMAVVPEMDLPGHARALLKSLPQLIDPADSSSYRSVQHHNDNVINPALAATNEALFTLIDEWCDIFEGELFHIGADEVPKGVWQGSPAAQAWCEATQKPLAQLQPEWIAKVEQYLKSKQKRMAGWEEVRDGGGASSECWVYSWQGVEAGLEAAQQGHKVVMTPAQHCYFDLAMNEDFTEPGYWWAGTLDIAQTYHYQPDANFGVATERIAGVQYCLWSELVTSASEAEYMWFPRLFAGAQVAWGGNTNEAYVLFQQSYKQWSKLFAQLNVTVREG